PPVRNCVGAGTKLVCSVPVNELKVRTCGARPLSGPVMMLGGLMNAGTARSSSASSESRRERGRGGRLRRAAKRERSHSQRHKRMSTGKLLYFKDRGRKESGMGRVPSSQ